MEGIVCVVKRVNLKVDIVMMYFVDLEKMEIYWVGNVLVVIQNYNLVVDYY